jgi:hypothetical protein
MEGDPVAPDFQATRVFVPLFGVVLPQGGQP